MLAYKSPRWAENDCGNPRPEATHQDDVRPPQKEEDMVEFA